VRRLAARSGVQAFEIVDPVMPGRRSVAQILLVEDDPGVRDVLCTSIAAEGHEVHCVASFAEAAQALSTGAHRLVVADIRLPDGSGAELAGEAIRQGKKAILISGHPEDRPRLSTHGLLYLVKPFRIEDLLRAIAAQVER
jgi:DNA-binding response OmpR family regulator